MLEVGTGFHAELTGRENIYLNGAILGMKWQEVEEKIDDIIAFSECETFIDTPVKRYSSGMYVKLAFAVAAHLNSEILLMDEVLAVGDMKFQKKCLEKMTELSEDEQKAYKAAYEAAKAERQSLIDALGSDGYITVRDYLGVELKSYYSSANSIFEEEE